MKLVDDIYVYEWTSLFDNNCNSYYIGGSVRAVIDPGLKKYFPDLLEHMKTDGIDTSKIRYIINTHSHPDHFEASELFNDRDDVSIGLHETEKQFFDETGPMMYGWFGLDFPKINVDLLLQEGPITLGDETFEIYLTPGHSPGSICLYWPRRKALIAGDVIFSQNVGRTDFPGGSGTLLKESIRKLSLLDVEHFLPGHMGIIEGKENIAHNFMYVMQQVFQFI